MAYQMEMKAFGVRVSGLYPTAVDTEMIRKEALAGNGNMQVMGKPVPVSQVVKAFNKALNTGALEVHIPKGMSVFTKIFGGLIPGSITRFTPLFEWFATKSWKRYLKKVREEQQLAATI